MRGLLLGGRRCRARVRASWGRMVHRFAEIGVALGALRVFSCLKMITGLARAEIRVICAGLPFELLFFFFQTFLYLVFFSFIFGP